MSFVRFLILLSLAAWVGALIFFPAVAHTAFSVLPDQHLAGLMVGRSLRILHVMGIISAVVFLGSSTFARRSFSRYFSARQGLVFAMLLLTLLSQFVIIPRMDRLRSSFTPDVHSAPAESFVENGARHRFDVLHTWSVRVEGAVLILGLAAVYLTAAAV